MITTEFYEGQGLGNQLWLYAACRSIAERLDAEFGIQSPERFKGKAFMDLDFGKTVAGAKHRGPSSELPDGVENYFLESKVLHPNGRSNITPFDPASLFIQDSTKIDGLFQAERYVEQYREKILGWFQSSKSLDLDENVCVISFRGGEYRYIPEVLLPPEFYRRAMELVREKNPGIKFVVVTDDMALANSYFPDLKILSHRKIPPIRRLVLHPRSKNIGSDFTWIQRAKYLILSNSSFSWWGAWSNSQNPYVIAPKYWARFNANDGYWALGDALTKDWTWVDAEGSACTYQQCLEEITLQG